jgi:hypothetical protein
MNNVYLLNLGFSQDSGATGTGRFMEDTPTNPIFTRSRVWLKYQPATPPPPSWVVDNVQQLTQALDPTQFAFLQTTTSLLNMDPSDFLVVRMFPAPTVTTGGKLRCTVVFGRGSSVPPSDSNLRQSPLQQLTSPMMPRSVVDTDPLDTSKWPTALSDGSWAWCLGMIHPSTDATKDSKYTFNAGASFAPPIGDPAMNNLYLYGHDPEVHVKGGGGV